MVVDMRDPKAGGAVDLAVTISAPAEEWSWTLGEGSRLTGDALEATESALGAMAPVAGGLAGAVLDADTAVTVPSQAGSVMVLMFEPSAK